ncbi:MAG: DUF4168 domain-containing protein [Alphaproteobacteria bacterium]|nr:DUF4168 domain-containing protein [Alphaproteobacteria bacterium]
MAGCHRGGNTKGSFVMKMRHLPVFALVALALAGTPMLSVQVQAQSAPENTAPGNVPAYEDQELKAYVTAAVQVAQISRDYTPKIQGAQSVEEKKKIQQEATGKMTQAVKNEGLSVEKYNEIYTAASMDPKLAQRLNGMLEKTQ